MADSAPSPARCIDVVFLDGIWLRRKAVAFIAVADGHVVAWHPRPTECASAWAALMLRVPAPKMAVCDGSPGFAGGTAVWRRRAPALHLPRRRAGEEMHDACAELEAESNFWASPTSSPMGETPMAPPHGFLEYNAWCVKGSRFSGAHVQRRQEGLRARAFAQGQAHPGTSSSGTARCSPRGDGTKSTAAHGPPPTTPSRASTRDFETCSGITEGFLLHRAKAILRCYAHTESPLPAAETWRVMPTDDDVTGCRRSVERIERGRARTSTERGSSGRSSICPRDTGSE